MDTDTHTTTAERKTPKGAPTQRELLDALVGIAMKHANEHFMDCVARLVTALQDVSDPGIEARAVHQRMKAGNVLKANSYAFFHLVSTGLELAIRKELDVLAPTLKKKVAANAASLSLVPYEEMDSKIAFGSLARPFDIKYSDELATLNVRLGLMLERDILRMGQNPFRPEVVLAAINQAWVEFEPDAESHPLLAPVLKPDTLFDLAPMYAELNGALQRKGKQPDSMDGLRIRKTRHAAAQKAAKAGSQEALAQQLRALFGDAGSAKAPAGADAGAVAAGAGEFDIPLIPDLPSLPKGEGGWRPSAAGAAFQSVAQPLPAAGPAGGLASATAATPSALGQPFSAAAPSAPGQPLTAAHLPAGGAVPSTHATAGQPGAGWTPATQPGPSPTGFAPPGAAMAPGGGAPAGPIVHSVVVQPGQSAADFAPLAHGGGAPVAGPSAHPANAFAAPGDPFTAPTGAHRAAQTIAHPGFVSASPAAASAGQSAAYPGFAPAQAGDPAAFPAGHAGQAVPLPFAVAPGMEVPVFTTALPPETYARLPASVGTERAPLFAYLSALQPVAIAAAAAAPDASHPPAVPEGAAHAGAASVDGAAAAPASGFATSAIPHNVVYLPQLKATMPQGALTRGDEHTIDLLGKIFETVYRDPSIPGEIRDLINFLQIPVLKAALLDKNFFFQDAHPARRLIELLSRLGWEQRKAPDDPVFQAMRRSVDRVGRDFDAEMEVFNDAVAELEAAIQSHEQAAEQALAEPIALAMRQEKRAIAVKSAQDAVRVRVGTGEVVAVVETFLQNRWTSVMTLAYTIEDDKPGAVNNATRTMDDLIWSVKPKATHEQRKELISKLPGLIQRLNKWLDVIKWQDAERLQFFAELAECHASIVRAPIELSPDRQLELAVEAAQKDALRRIEQEKAAEEAVARAEAELDDVELTVDSLERGMWVEFQQEDGTQRKVKLAWVSPRRTLFIFSTGARQEAFSMPAGQLVDALRDGKATLIGLEGVVGRALSEAIGAPANDPEHTAAA